MKQYSQNDPKWASIRMGNSSTTIGRSGCFITSLGMLCGKTPDVVNSLIAKGGGYGNGALLNSDRAAQILNLPYKGRSSTRPPYACIVETNYYAPGYPQHFFVLLSDGTIIDPLNGKLQSNKYKNKIVSYRLFQENNSNQGDLLMALLQDVKLTDLPEVEFNKFHDIANSQYPGWTAEIYNKNGVNAYAEYKGVSTIKNVRDLLNYMENKPEFIAMRKKLQTQGSPVNKQKIKDLAQQIINEAK